MDLVRIFKAVISALLVIVFLGLLVSAYVRYRAMISTAGLVDASSSITNHLVLEDLVYEEAGSTHEYVVDPSKLPQLSFSENIGGDTFSFQVCLRYGPGAETVLGPYGPEVPEGKAVAPLSVPVVVAENYRFKAGKLEVRVWRA
jgi:hypothetical protein